MGYPYSWATQTTLTFLSDVFLQLARYWSSWQLSYVRSSFHSGRYSDDSWWTISRAVVDTNVLHSEISPICCRTHRRCIGFRHSVLSRIMTIQLMKERCIFCKLQRRSLAAITFSDVVFCRQVEIRLDYCDLWDRSLSERATDDELQRRSRQLSVFSCVVCQSVVEDIWSLVYGSELRNLEELTQGPILQEFGSPLLGELLSIGFNRFFCMLYGTTRRRRTRISDMCEW